MKKECIRTLKFIKWTKLLTLIYIFLCIFSLIVIYISRFPVLHNTRYFEWAASTLLIWCLNPMVLIISLLGIIKCLNERKNAEKRKIIGKRWVWFIVCNIITFFVWFTSIIFWVYFTGGV